MDIDTIKNIPMGDLDIKKYIQDANIVIYHDLIKYKNIDAVFNNNDHVFLLYGVASKNNGHWCVLIKDKKYIYYFDSYGGDVDNPLKYVKNENKRKIMNQNYCYLKKLLIDSPYTIYYNNIKFQNNNTSTCGRYCVFFVLLFRKYKINLQQFEKFLKILKNNCNMSYDALISSIIDNTGF